MTKKETVKLKKSTPKKKNKLALAMIVKGTVAESKVLDRCLKSVHKYVDGIFITITQPSKEVEAVCNKYNAVISHFAWEKDFSKARNFNFAQVTKDFEYILWLDADDVVKGVKHIKNIFDNTDVFILNYVYHLDADGNPDVVHIKSRVVRNDGCVEWKGTIHEDLTPTRNLTTKFVKDIEIVHLTDDERVEESKVRNLEIAQKMLKETPDDPRSYWNLGNAHKATMNSEEALQAFAQFLKTSQSEEEKYIVHNRIAEIYLNEKENSKALEHANISIGMYPGYPDGYIMKAHVLFEMQNYEQAAAYYKASLERKRPLHNINAYNPRDYDFYPLLALAKCYIHLSLPSLAIVCLEGCVQIMPSRKDLKAVLKTLKKESAREKEVIETIKRLETITDKEELKKELDNIEDDFKSHPGVCLLRNKNFIKEKSSGKDLVIYCYATNNEWHANTQKGIGGSEEAVINIADQLSKLGWNVSVYNNCGYKDKKCGSVTYKPHWTWNYRDKQDVVIIWRQPAALDYDINADRIYVDVHDVIQPGEFNEKRIAKMTKALFKTQAHRKLYAHVPDDKVAVIPNGMDFALFDQDIKKDQYLMVNTSSPERSLDVLPKLFKEVKKRVPQAKCKWAYGFNNFDTVHAGSEPHMQWKQETLDAMEEAGIENLGRLSQKDAAKLYLEGNVFAYPSLFFEIDCISAKKAQACGATPVVTNFAAFPESVKNGVLIDTDINQDTWAKPYQFHFGLTDEKGQQEWVDAVVKILQTPIDDREYMKEPMKRYAWDVVANEWNDEIQST